MAPVSRQRGEAPVVRCSFLVTYGLEEMSALVLRSMATSTSRDT